MNTYSSFFVDLLFLWFGRAKAPNESTDDCFTFAFAGLDVNSCARLITESPIIIHNLSEQLNFSIKYSDVRIDLNLIKTGRNVFNEHTNVWIDKKEFGKRKLIKNSISTIIPSFETAQVYVDERNSAVLIASAVKDFYVLEGYIGRFLLTYNLDSNFYELNENFVSSNGSTANKTNLDTDRINPDHFNLKSTKENVELKLLIAIDIFDEKEIKLSSLIIKLYLLQFTTANMIFHKFSSPGIQLNITDFILTNGNPNLLNTRNEEDYQHFANDNLDAVFTFKISDKYSSKEEWKEIDMKSTTLPIRNSKIPVFEHSIIGISFNGLQYLNLADCLAHVVREDLLKFPFSINIPKVAQNLFNLTNVWTWENINPDETLSNKNQSFVPIIIGCFIGFTLIVGVYCTLRNKNKKKSEDPNRSIPEEESLV